MRILHFSDPHLPPRPREVPLTDWLGKRIPGAINHWLRRRHHFQDVEFKLERLARFAQEKKVDLVVCTGDYSLLGTTWELAEARRAIEPLTAAPLGYLTLPGNHDLYVPDTVRQQRFEKHFGDLMRSDEPEYRTDGRWPLVCWAGTEAAVVAVSSAWPHLLPWDASGRIPYPQLQGLALLLDDPEIRRRFVFVMTHHAPRLADGRPDSRGHGLRNADDLLSVCAGLERGAVLFGHVHHCFRVQVPGLKTALFGAGSVTYAGREGFWLFELEEGSASATRGVWSGEAYRLDPDRRYPC